MQDTLYNVPLKDLKQLTNEGIGANRFLKLFKK